MSHVRHQEAPKTAQEPPKTPKTALNSPRRPKMLPARPKTPMDASKTPPDLDFGASRPEFLEIFTCKIINYWIVWGSLFKCEFLPDYISFHTRICKMIVRLFSCCFDAPSSCCLITYVLGAVAGTQLCCALDPPRQALCLRMAYRVRYPNQPAHLPFLLIILPNLPFPLDILRIYIQNNPKES